MANFKPGCRVLNETNPTTMIAKAKRTLDLNGMKEEGQELVEKANQMDKENDRLVYSKVIDLIMDYVEVR